MISTIRYACISVIDMCQFSAYQKLLQIKVLYIMIVQLTVIYHMLKLSFQTCLKYIYINRKRHGLLLPLSFEKC